MKRYKRIIEDTSDDREIIDTKHAIERYAERYSSVYTKEKIDSVIQKVIEVIINKYKDKSGEYGFHSKSTLIGGVLDWVRYGDAKKDTGKNNAVIITLFPPKKIHTFKKVNAEILVEQIMYSLREQKGYNWRLREDKRYGLGEIYYFDESKEHYVVLFEREFYESTIQEYIVIE